MSAWSASFRPIHVGVALAPRSMVAVVPGAPAARAWAFADAGESAVAPELRSALGALHAALGDAAPRGVLHVSLLPPFARLRFLDVPGIDAIEAQRVVARDASRYVPVHGGTEPLVVEIESSGPRGRRPFVATIASRALVEAVHGAALAAGWRRVRIVSAYSAWSASARLLLPATSLARTLVLCDDDEVAILGVRDGYVAALRRFPARAPDVAALVAPLLHERSLAPAGSPARLAVIGDGVVADALRALTGSGSPDTASGRRSGVAAESPALVAARFARRARGPLLLTDSERTSREHRSRRNTRVRFVAAALLLAAAAGVELWGATRERVSLAGERSRIRDAVSRALSTRDSLTMATDRLASLRSTIDGSPRWSRVVTSLASELPEDAFLTALRAAEDTLRLEGTATRAAPVFEALRGDPVVRSVRPDGPIRQEVADGETTESFSLLASLRRAP